MPADFHRTLRSIEADRPLRRAFLFAPAAALLVAWGAWLALGELQLHEIADDARVEVELAAHAVGAPRDGRLVAIEARLGRDVRAGDVLAVYDARDVELELEAVGGRLAALDARIAAARRELEARDEAEAALAPANEARRAEAAAKVEEARTALRALERRASTLESLASEGTSSRETARDARDAADAAAARVSALEQAALCLAPEAEIERRDRRVEREALSREIALLEGEVGRERSERARLERELSERTVRAPIAGRIGEEPPLRAGSVVLLGDRLTRIVPAGEPRVLGSVPASAIGRVRPGQSARLRFDGFPWTRYGFRHATVAHVGSPDEHGRVAIEFAPRAGEVSRIPLDHGLACTAEIEVERVRPLDLVLRKASRVVATAERAR